MQFYSKQNVQSAVAVIYEAMLGRNKKKKLNLCNNYIMLLEDIESGRVEFNNQS